MTLDWQAISVILVIVGHAILLVRGWTIIEYRLKTLTESFQALNESLHERDVKMEAAWRKLDGHEGRLLVMETRLSREKSV